MARPKPDLLQPDEERPALTRRADRPKSTQRRTLRARIIVAGAEATSDKAVAPRLGAWEATVGTGRQRFVARLGVLADDPRPAADDEVERVAGQSLETKPAHATYRGTRGMARAGGRPRSTVGRVGRAFGRPPHRADTSKRPADPPFVDKVRDVVGLTLPPPENAIVLWVDEQPQRLASDRPSRFGRWPRPRRAPTTTPGPPPPRCSPPATSPPGRSSASATGGTGAGSSWSSSITCANLSSRPGVSVRIAPGYDGTHPTAAVTRRFLRHPEDHRHVIPTSRSWRDSVARFFAALTAPRTRRGVFTSVPQRERATADGPAEHTKDPKPFM